MPTQPGYQWGDAGGYCGSFATQRAAMAKGAWISQQQVRDHTSPGAPGSHDEEILDTNIARAWKNLKLKYEAFDYRDQPTPQLALTAHTWRMATLSALLLAAKTW